MMMTPSEKDAFRAKQRGYYHKCLNVCLDWLSIIFDSYDTLPEFEGTGFSIIIDIQPFADAMIKHLGQEKHDEYYSSAMAGVQEELFDKHSSGERLTFCDAWKWAHNLYHLCYPREA